MGIRIDPSLEFVWRDLQTVQIGVDPPRAVVPVETLAEERFLMSLRRETSRQALPALAAQARCDPTAAAAVLAAAAPVLTDGSDTDRGRVEVHGEGALVDHVRDHLTGEGVTVVRTDSPLGGPVGRPRPEPDLAVAVADHVLDPIVRSAWLHREVPHLTVVVGDGRIRVGPVVEPDRGPCLHCVELARVDEDEAWPTLASQLWGRGAAPLSLHRCAAIASVVCRVVLARLDAGGPEPAGVAADSDAAPASATQLLVDRATLVVTERTMAPHPRCACAALPGNDSADVPRRARLPAGPR